MIYLITTILLGIGFTYLAIENTSVVTLQAGNHVFSDIPLYLVVLGGLLSGLLLAWFLSGIGSIGMFLRFRRTDAKLHQKEKAIDEKDNQIVSLSEEIARLKTENEQLKTKYALERREKPTYNPRNFFQHLPQI